jgi:hypothetical protein
LQLLLALQKLIRVPDISGLSPEAWRSKMSRDAFVLSGKPTTVGKVTDFTIPGNSFRKMGALARLLYNGHFLSPMSHRRPVDLSVGGWSTRLKNAHAHYRQKRKKTSLHSTCEHFPNKLV